VRTARDGQAARPPANFEHHGEQFLSTGREGAPHGAAADGAPGLTSEEAARRLLHFGANALPDERPSAWRRFAGKLWAPVPWMLESAIVLQLALGEYVEAAVIAALVVFNGALGFIQEGRAEATLEALKSRLALFASVRRDGAWKSVPASELVPGDVVRLALGSVVGADVRLLEGEVLLDQSMLTGESLPVEGAPGRITFAGALVRRGEAIGEVVATGPRTRFGRSAELVRTAHGASSQQLAVLRVVRNLALFNGTIVIAQIAYAAVLGLPTHEIIPLTLTAILAAIPVALPATFTLAGALGARSLARLGVLPTRLSAVDEAGTLDVLCADKTGTLTRNELRVTAVRALPGVEESRVLALAALASSEGTQDPVDAAICAAAPARDPAAPPRRTRFVPFDPATKMSEAEALDAHGATMRIVKGAPSKVSALASGTAQAEASAAELSERGFRVLAVAAGPRGAPLSLVGLVALSDPPRADSAQLVAQLRSLGVATVMVTGDAPATAAVVARAVGLADRIAPAGPPPEGLHPEQYTVFAGVFPEDKFHIVRAFQLGGHTVGMCGDGANDAPALRQAQMGIAVSTATDVAKSAAGIVLTQPGLAGIVSAVREGRVAFERIFVYTLRSMTLKIGQMLLLAAGLLMTGHAVLSPLLIAIVVIAGDFLAMSATTDNVTPSAQPEHWRINQITLVGAALGACYVAFCTGVLAVGHFSLGLELRPLRTLAAVALVAGGQAAYYCVRTRGALWSTRPSLWVILASLANLLVIGVLAWQGWLMAPLGPALIGATLLAAAAFALALDRVKIAVLARVRVD